jgi:hypothetical protein
MRPEDLRKLEGPYADKDHENGTNFAFLARLDVSTGNLRSLLNAITDDLADGAPFGIGWWSDETTLGTTRRILIADQLWLCTESISKHLVEANLHWLEFLDNAEKASSARANDLTLDGNTLSYTRATTQSPANQLMEKMEEIHLASCVVSLTAALDCLGGTIIGVLALPSDILRSDLAKARQALRQAQQPVQTDFRTQFEEFLQAAGPEGWLDWLIGYRNMLVHRGRRLQLNQLVRRKPEIYGHDGQTFLRAEPIRHLPRCPSQSDIETFRRPRADWVLHEDARITVRGLKLSAEELIEESAEILFQVWRQRRDNPSLLMQPVDQWKAKPENPPDWQFQGYRPGSIEFGDPQGLGVSHPILDRRLRAASLTDDALENWDRFN